MGVAAESSAGYRIFFCDGRKFFSCIFKGKGAGSDVANGIMIEKNASKANSERKAV